MAREVTLFTGQWADLPLEELAAKAAAWGFDGLELACWGDHFEVGKALADDGYVAAKRELLDRHGLKCYVISNHLVGQCVCDFPIETPATRASCRPKSGATARPRGYGSAPPSA